MEDLDALARWGRNGQHLVEVYEPQSTDQDMTEERLRSLTENELEKRINASVEYKGGIADLEYVPGMGNKKIRFGDTIRIKDTSYEPALYLEARIHTVDRDIVNLANKKVELGDYEEFTEDEVHAIFNSLQAEIAKKISETQLLEVTYNKTTIDDKDQSAYESSTLYTEQYAEKKKVISSFAPSDETVIWVDNSNPDNVVWKVWDGTVWKEGPSGPKGEDGYTPVKGVDYFDGVDGQDGTSSYLWVRYSQNADGSNMTTDPTNALYIGVATTTTPSAPTSNTEYNWSLIKGDQGVKGETGSDGRTSYLHIKYSNDGGTTFTANSGEDVGDWIGTYVDFNSTDSANVADYTWNKVKGEKGDQGPQGPQGIQGPPGEDGIAYMGPTEPDNPAVDSTWFQTNSSGQVIAIKKWNGTTWDTAKMTVDVLNVIKLSALSTDLGSVKAGSISGVTMNLANGKFVVDAAGNVAFAGNLEGATGTFNGSVEVGNVDNLITLKDGQFQSVDSTGHIKTAIDELGINVTDDTTAGLEIGTQVTPGRLFFHRLNGSSYSGINHTQDDGLVIYNDRGDVDINVLSQISVISAYGNGQFGAKNSTSFHLDTDRPRFYSYKPLTVAGNIRSEGGYIESNSFDHTGSGTNLFLRPKTGYRVNVTELGTTTTYAPIMASEHQTPSAREDKTDIEVFEEDVLSAIKNMNAYRYKRIGKEDDPYKQLGLMLDEAPVYLHGSNGDSIEQYALNTFTVKGLKQLLERVEKLEGMVS